MNDRKKFEAWAKAPDGGNWQFDSFSLHEDGRYLNLRIQQEWNAWQAALKQRDDDFREYTKNQEQLAKQFTENQRDEADRTHKTLTEPVSEEARQFYASILKDKSNG